MLEPSAHLQKEGLFRRQWRPRPIRISFWRIKQAIKSALRRMTNHKVVRTMVMFHMYIRTICDKIS